MKHSTGVRRLDEIVGGGLPDRSMTIAYGPAFVGKETFAQLFVLSGLRQRIPAILVLTDESSTDVRRQLTTLDPKFHEYEEQGLVYFVDCYSKSIGAVEARPRTEYVDGLINFNAVSVAVNNAQRGLIGDFPSHRLLFDSVSTLVTYTNAATAFRFLQILLGKARAAGATGVLLLEQGMHSDPEVQSIKHLATGVIEFRPEGNKFVLKVDGAGVVENRGWVEYRFTDSTLEITGSFAMGRIR